MIKDLTFITGNANKAAQVEKYLSIKLKHQSLDLIEIQSLDSQEIIKHKAIEAYKQIKSPVAVEDISMVMTALGKLPGPFIKWFSQEIGLGGMCEIINNYPDRSAHVEATVGLYDGKELQIFSAKVKGRIADKPRGENGFGFDEIFMPEGYSQTRAEMDEKNLDKTNHRRKVWKLVEKFIKQDK